ncbi:MAG: hypothetical protein IJR24_05645, partial [Alloprevotella sp.]|nr:hypothetical protein [Alloprevotella sp.]
ASEFAHQFRHKRERSERESPHFRAQRYVFFALQNSETPTFLYFRHAKSEVTPDGRRIFRRNAP